MALGMRRGAMGAGSRLLILGGGGMLRGECLCGAVGYEVEDAFTAAFNCHCSNCRKATASAFKPMGVVPADRLTLTRGEDRLLIYGDRAQTQDVRCAGCSSLLYSVIDNGNTHVTLGTLIDATSIAPQFHIFVGSKAPWYEIADALPQFDEFPE